MREKIETLKNHSRLQTHFLKQDPLLWRKLAGFALSPSYAQVADRYGAAIEEFEEVDAAQQRGFAAAGRAHNDRQFAAWKFESEIFEESMTAE